jgi:hypothetical protein
MEGKDTSQPEEERKETLAEKINRVLESTREIVTNFTAAHELRAKANQAEQTQSSHPSSGKSP